MWQKRRKPLKGERRNVVGRKGSKKKREGEKGKKRKQSSVLRKKEKTVILRHHKWREKSSKTKAQIENTVCSEGGDQLGEKGDCTLFMEKRGPHNSS